MNLALRSIEPAEGPTHGGNLVKVLGEGLTAGTRFLFDGVPAPVLLAQQTVCYVQVPAHAAGFTDVVALRCGLRSELAAGYRFRRPDLAAESDLTRLVRGVLRQLKQHIIQNTSITVDVEYAGSPAPEGAAVALASLPTLVLTGPELRENRLGSSNVGCELTDGSGNFVQYAPAYTTDLSFNLVGASSSTVELLNLLSATVLFLTHAGGVSLPRDPTLPDAGTVRWALRPAGEARTHFDCPDGIKSFSCTFVVQAFDIAAHQPCAVSPATEEMVVQTSNKGGDS